MGSVIAVLSGKGGTGKTTLCAGISIALSRMDQRVLCIDCDVGLRNLDIPLGLSDSGALSFLDVLEGGYSLSDTLCHPDYPNLSFLTAPMNRRVEQIDVDGFRLLIHAARSMFDYILLDAPAGVEGGFHLAASVADRCILVTGSGPASVRDAARVGQILELAGKNDVRILVNRVDKVMLSILDQTIDDVMDDTGLPLLGVVLEDPDVPMAAAGGKSLLAYNRRSATAKAFARIARRIQGYPEPIKFR